MSAFRVLSTTTIRAPNAGDSTVRKIELTPWDLQFLPFGANQKGVLYHHPTIVNTSNKIQHLKQSLSHVLAFFPPFAGRLEITEHEDNTISCSITCNNAGALFVHAKAENTCVADILGSTYLPSVFHSFFPLNGVINYEGTSHPLLAFQVTELVDGTFVSWTMNHVVNDGMSTLHFMNSLAEISRGSSHQISVPPTLERLFPNGIQRPIRFPFIIKTPQIKIRSDEEQLIPTERIFHFTKENIARLKLKANIEAGTNKISSMQALCTHLWRSVIRSKQLDPQEEVNFVLCISVRSRLVPQLSYDYFGNAMIVCGVTMKVKELLEEGGLGKGALEMYKIIALHSDEKLKSQYESWLRTPNFVKADSVANGNSLVISGSPLFSVYDSDIGWGNPVAVRSGSSNKSNGKISVFAGKEEGSMDFEVCLPYKILEVMGNDPELNMTDASTWNLDPLQPSLLCSRL